MPTIAQQGRINSLELPPLTSLPYPMGPLLVDSLPFFQSGTRQFQRENAAQVSQTFTQILFGKLIRGLRVLHSVGSLFLLILAFFFSCCDPFGLLALDRRLAVHTPHLSLTKTSRSRTHIV